jgi:hypothetical protein
MPTSPTSDQQQDRRPHGRNEHADTAFPQRVTLLSHDRSGMSVDTASSPVLLAYETPETPETPRASQPLPGERVSLSRPPEAEGPPPVDLPTRRPRTRTRRRALLACTVAVAIVVGLIAVAAVRGASGPGPEELVRTFFASLTARDAAALRAVVSCSSLPVSPMCQDEALQAGYQPPERMHIDGEREETPSGTSRGAKQRLMLVSYDVAGQRRTDTVTVGYARTGMFGGRWSIIDPPGSAITVPKPTIAAVKLASLNLPAAAKDEVTFWAPPGAYTATRPGNALYEPAETTVVVADTPVTVTLPAALKTALHGDIEQSIRDRIDACAAQHVFNPNTEPRSSSLHPCPMQHRTLYTITSDPQWSVLRYPTIRLNAAPDGAITITTINPGKAAIHYQWTFDVADPRVWHPVDAVEDIIVEGWAWEADGKPEWITP